ncbi:hypothetical protein [Rhodoplanes serenus]|uniref:hypothetical protein n=1 Tax=Rhodoplanes serenus TaxID=200615 RepID=UPI0011B946A0|nr:hypothetical protein [Rhodoplanes serenus]
MKDRIELGIDPDTARLAASTKGAPIGRVHNREFVDAFLEYESHRQYSASSHIGFETEYFRISRDIVVPIAPLSVIRERGRFVPIFVCGWSTNPLRLRQRRLLMTIYEDAFLSITDFQSSPAEILFFPKFDSQREAEPWLRGDYDLLPQSELDECVEIFLEARELVRRRIIEERDSVRPTEYPDE